MRFLLLFATIALTAVFGGSAAARQSHLGTSCGPAGARTLAQDGGARVYEAGGSVYGCSKQSRRITRLGTSGSCGATGSMVERVALAGQAVAYGLHSCGVDFGFTQVVVRRLRDGAQLGSFAATEKSTGPESTSSVSSLVVKPDGATAWIGTGSSIISPAAQNIEVRTGHGNRRRLLDSGAQIGTRSLRLSGSHLSWLHGQTRRSAILN